MHREYCDQAAAHLCENGYRPLVAQVLAARGIERPEDIKQDVSSLPGVSSGHAEKATRLLAELAQQKKRWCILGDYDADGMCATALAKLALEALEIDADWLLSHRDYQYRSIDPVLVDRANEKGAEVLLTVDGGTNSVEGIRRAKELGMTVIVTDHHPPMNGIATEADAVANPHLEDSGLPTKGMCGTTVMLVLVRELFSKLGVRHRASKYIDLAAVATMSDVMPMDDRFNRSIVMAGIESIRKGRCRPVLRSILRHRHTQCCPSDLNFRIGPLLNSAHRMSRAELGVEALLAEDIKAANELAEELGSLNRERRLQSAKVIEEAAAQIQEFSGHGAVAFSDSWDVSIVGLAASHLVDKFRMPVTMLCEHNGVVRGSMRSVNGISLLDILAAIEKDSPGLLGESGGHSYAAGVRLNGDVDIFKKLFDTHCARLSEEDSTEDDSAMVDGNPSVEDLSDGTVQQLNDIPWGQKEFPKPRFEGEFTVRSLVPTRRGTGYLHELELGGTVLKGYYRKKISEPGDTIRMSYTVSADNYSDLPFIHPSRVA